MKRWEMEQYLDVLEKASSLSYLKAEIKKDLLEGTWPGEKATALSALETGKVLEQSTADCSFDSYDFSD
jgi:hypothetical protein